MSAGQARLGLVYDAKDGRHLVFMFSADRDQRGRSVDDRVIAYVYDEQTKKLVGKFWVPMS